MSAERPDWELLHDYARSADSAGDVPALASALASGGVPGLLDALSRAALEHGERSRSSARRAQVATLELDALVALAFWRIHGQAPQLRVDTIHAQAVEDVRRHLTDVGLVSSFFTSLDRSVCSELAHVYARFRLPSGLPRVELFAQAFLVHGHHALLGLDPSTSEAAAALAWLAERSASSISEVHACRLAEPLCEALHALLGRHEGFWVPVEEAAPPTVPAGSLVQLRPVTLVPDPAFAPDEVLVSAHHDDPDVHLHLPPPVLRGDWRLEWRYHELRTSGLSPSDALAATLAT